MKIITIIISRVITEINVKMDTVQIKKFLKIKWFEEIIIKILININLGRNLNHL